MLAPVVLLFFLLLSLSAVAAGRTAPGLLPVKKTPAMDGIALPLVSFSSDQGFGYGAVGGMYLYAPGKTPYAHALSAQVFFSSRGAMNH
ncbi:MAG: hypothetical protein EOO72_09005, partial [Myxococcaceae bacterium]